MSEPAAGVLYVVSTPIGNLGDMTFRAVEALSSAALVVAEDTRHSRHLLTHFRIGTPVRSYHEHNEARETPALVERMTRGESIALITDAGTPLVSDPGARLVAASAAAGIRVVPVPGASALLAALVGSALGTDRFLFLGFLERKGAQRREDIARIVAADVTVALFESPNRVSDTLNEIAAAGAGARGAVVARELTKKFEEFRRASVAELAAAYSEADPRGEVVILIEGKSPEVVTEAEIAGAAAELARAGSSPREVMDALVADYGAPRNLAYRIAHAATATEPRKKVTKRDEQV